MTCILLSAAGLQAAVEIIPDPTYYPEAVVPQYTSSAISVIDGLGNTHTGSTNLWGQDSGLKFVFPVIPGFIGLMPVESETYSMDPWPDYPTHSKMLSDTQVTEHGIVLYQQHIAGGLYGISGSGAIDYSRLYADWSSEVEYWNISPTEGETRGVILKPRLETVGQVRTVKYRRIDHTDDPYNAAPAYDSHGPSLRGVSNQVIEQRSVVAGIDTVSQLYPGSNPLFVSDSYVAIVRITESRYISSSTEAVMIENGVETPLGVDTELPPSTTIIEWLVKGHGLVRSVINEGEHLDLIMLLGIFNDGSNVTSVLSLADLGLDPGASEVVRSGGGSLLTPSDTQLTTTGQQLEMWPLAYYPPTDRTWYLDADGDGYGDESIWITRQDPPYGYVLTGGDCDDSDPTIHPRTVWYPDSDGDGYGDAFGRVYQCTQPAGYVSDDSDSDDANASLHPAAALFVDGAADTDGDGVGDLVEYALRLNPHGWNPAQDASRMHELLKLPFEGVDVLHLDVRPGAPGFEVWLEFSADPGFAEPTAIQGVLTGETGADDMEVMVFRDTARTAQAAQGFARFVFRETATTAAMAAEFALIPAGSFLMGDSHGDGTSVELPQHQVTLDAFRIQTTEVTNAQMAEVMNWALAQGLASASATSVSNAEGAVKELLDLDVAGIELSYDGSALVMDAGKEDYPCTGVTWYGAQAYSNYLSDRGSLARSIDFADWSIDTTQPGYRLPTEAEWEMAARGGLAGMRFPWGDLISHDNANYQSTGVEFSYDTHDYTLPTPHPDYDGGGYPYTSPVKSFAPNGFGLYDMSGNVFEWCGDWYGAYGAGPYTNPLGPASSGNGRTLRGGSWYNNAYGGRVAFRTWSPPGASGNHLGFRPVLPQ